MVLRGHPARESGRHHRGRTRAIPALPLQCADKRVDEHRVELAARPLTQLGDRFVDLPGAPVRTGRGHRVEGVGHRDDPREFGDLAGGQAERVALAVHPLVVMHDAGQRFLQEPDLPDDLKAAHRMKLDGGQFLFGQRARLLQDLGGHAELPHVVQHAGVPDGLDPFRVHADLAGEHRRSLGHPLAVAAGIEVLGLDGLAECGHGRGVGTLLGGELSDGPAGHEQRDQHEDRREDADQAPQRGDQQAQRRIPRIRGEQHRQVHVEPGPAG
jgi:hypothetical protein